MNPWIKKSQLIQQLKMNPSISKLKETDITQSVASHDTAPEPFQPLPFAFARNNNVLIDGLKDNGKLAVIYTEPVNVKIFSEIRRHYKSQLTLSQISREDFDQALQKSYEDSSAQASDLMNDLDGEMDLKQLADSLPEPEDLMESGEEAFVIRLINSLVTEAIRKDGSDIHIEPLEHRLRVRIRIDGMLNEVLQPPKDLAPFITSRIKIMSRLDIAEKRLPQDGRISLKLAGRPVDVRVSTIPGAHGERVVLRLLDKQAGRLELSELGMQKADQQKVDELIHQPHGILLVTGPTGSGKTTTLYSALSRLNSNSRNIMTVEDPIEYYLDGIGQTQVNTKIDMSFARGLRAILRQDPDVVMIGEIRDRETAEIAVQSSLTGHLVFSTLHTNTAIGAIARLRDMGVEPYLLSSSLIGVIAQRLVRLLCPECKHAEPVNEADLNMLSTTGTSATQLFHPTGCASCNHTGYKSRTGIFEVVEINPALKSLIHDNAGEQLLVEGAHLQSDGIREAGFNMAVSGITSLEEVIRVTQKN
jgi:general secretion pathway protein E